MGWNWMLSSMQYGNRWRAHRRLFHKHFHPTASLAYYPIQIKETNTLLRNFLDEPEDFSVHVRRWFCTDVVSWNVTKTKLLCRSSAAIVVMISYGYQVAPKADHYVSLADQALASLGKAGIFGTFLVDYIPQRASPKLLCQC